MQITSMCSKLILVILILLFCSSFTGVAQKTTYLSIRATRTITTNGECSGHPGKCPGHNKVSFSSTYSINLSCDKALIEDDGNVVSVGLDGTPKSNGVNRWTGSNNLNGQFSSNATDFCQKNEMQGSANMGSDLSNTSFSFTYNRETKQGDFSLAPGYTDPTGTGTIKMTDNQGKTTTTNAASLIAAQTNLYAGYRAIVSKNYDIIQSKNLTPSMIASMKQINAMQDVNGNGGMCQITDEKTGGFSASYTNTVNRNVPCDVGWEGTGSVTVTTSVQIYIGHKPIEYDAILTVVTKPGYPETYAGFIPKGPPVKNDPKNPVLKKGNQLFLHLDVVDKNDPKTPLTGLKYDVDYVLSEVSKEPGFCLNYPLKNGDVNNDLVFDSSMKDVTAGKYTYANDKISSTDYRGSEVEPIITSYDYGSYGKLRVTVTLKSGISLEAHFAGSAKTTIPIPKDDNNNHIADQWEINEGIFSKNLDADWDKETQSGNTHDGDGFTLFEEYRGIVAKQDHHRLSSTHKDIVIANKSSVDLTSGIGYFTKATNGDIIPIEVKAGDELDSIMPIVNKNSDYARGGDQFGIIFKMSENLKGSNGEDVLGQVFPKKDVSTGANSNGGLLGRRAGNEPVASSPKDVDSLVINSTLDPDIFTYTFAHELAHCLGVQHHGDAPVYIFNPIDHYIVEEQGFKYVDENGKPLPLDPLKNDIKNNSSTGDMVAAIQGSEACGDVNCIMTYNQDFAYSFPNGHGGKILIHANIRYPNGTSFCTSKEGTGRNAGKNSVFGPATTGGNCVSLFQVKDY